MSSEARNDECAYRQGRSGCFFRIQADEVTTRQKFSGGLGGGGGVQIGFGDSLRERAGAKCIHRLQQNLARCAAQVRLESSQRRRIGAPVPPHRMWIDDHPPADGRSRRRAPQDEAITFSDDNGVLKNELQPAGFAGRQGLAAQHAGRRHRFGSADEEFHFGIVFERRVGIGEAAELNVDQFGRTQCVWVAQHIAALEVGNLNTCEVDGDSAPRHSTIDF